jgi:hypothetical protein
MYKKKIFHEIELNGTISINTLYEMVISLPTIKYFDISSKTWNEYEIYVVELHEHIRHHPVGIIVGLMGEE